MPLWRKEQEGFTRCSGVYHRLLQINSLTPLLFLCFCFDSYWNRSPFSGCGQDGMQNPHKMTALYWYHEKRSAFLVFIALWDLWLNMWPCLAPAFFSNAANVITNQTYFTPCCSVSMYLLLNRIISCMETGINFPLWEYKTVSWYLAIYSV